MSDILWSASWYFQSQRKPLSSKGCSWESMKWMHFQLVFISTLILTSHGYKWRDSVLIRNINANFWYTLVVKYQLLSEIQTCANYYEQCQRYFISELMICFVLSQNRIPYLYSDHELFGSFVIITWINRSYRLNNRSCVQNK